MHLIYHPEAETEIIEAAEYYDRQVPGLGGQFLDEIEVAVAAIFDAPERWRRVDNEIRRYLAGRFPFGIYYRVEGEVIRILAVKHHRRHPDYWRKRR
jgi:plasmid stabilization system protein ParE